MKFKNNLRTIANSLIFVLIALITVGSLLSAAAAAPQEPSPPGIIAGTVELPPEALSISENLLPTSPMPSHPKMDSTMAELSAAADSSAEAVYQRAEALQVNLSGDRVQAYVIPRQGNLAPAQASIRRAGGEVTGVGFDGTIIQAWLPVASLEQLASLSEIDYIRQPDTVVLADVQATTEGVAVMNADTWHAGGYTGTGVKVVIIDLGFEGYNALKGSDLPNSIVAKNFVDGESDAEVDGTTKHGTACAEIVYDIAPGAMLYIAKVNSTVDLEEAVDWAKANNADVISMSLAFFNTSPGDGTGGLIDLVQDARNAGILWATAAGNYREMHWGGAFNDPDNNDYHNFDGDQEINFFGPGDGTAYYLNSGYYLKFFMRWDDWTNVNQDYELLVARWNGSNWEIIASSNDPQNGGAGQRPTEAATALTSGDAAPYGFLIHRINSNRNVHFEVLAPNTAHMDEYVYARSFAEPADAPAAMTVAALDVHSPYPQEPYSSEGPTNGPGGTEAGGFIKPDISGFANVSTESYGAGGFNGTSSATPHVAGAAALVFGAYPGYSPSQVQDFLEGRAIDMGSAGTDTVYGYGRLHLGDPPGPMADRIWNGSVSSDWHTADNWTPSGVPTSDLTVLIPDTSRDPVVSAANAEAKDLTIDPGAVLDLTSRTITVEGTLTNNGTMKQTLDVNTTSTTQFLRILNKAGTQLKYLGVDVSPYSIGTGINPDSASKVSSPAPDAQTTSQPLLARVIDTIKGWFSTPADDEVANEAPLDAVSPLAKPGIPPDDLHFSGVVDEVADPLPEETPPAPPPGRQVELKLDQGAAFPAGSSSELLPSAPQANVSMVLDDGGIETGYGVNNDTNSYQFIWLNRFTPDASEFPFQLNEIRVMFADNGGSWGVHVGDAIDLVVYEDANGDPTDGATWLATFNETIQAVDGTTWSVYTLSSPVTLNGPGDVLIGVIDRFVESGVTEKTSPATLDTTSSQERSWIGWWTTDPPNPPTLPPDDTFDLMTGDSAGNWLVRGYGETISSEGIYGHVSYNGSDASGIYLVLRHYNGSEWVTEGSAVATDSNGDYMFTGAPTLGSGEVYYVRYENGNNGNLDVTDYLSAWYSFQLSSYTAGTSVHGGDFDIADIVQVSPDSSATVTLPQTFTWTRRSATTSDSYAFNLYDPDDSNTEYESEKLGYVDNYTLNSLPSGFVYDKQYAWYVKAYAPDDGFGYPYYARYITFTGGGATDTPTPTSTNTPTPTATTSVTPTEPTNTPTPTATLTPQPGDTSVTVSVSGNQFCSEKHSGVMRCYDISPVKSMIATLTFYFTDLERNGISKDKLFAYHYDAGWQQEAGPYTNGGSGIEQYVSVENVDDFSSFALDQEFSGPYLCMVQNYAGPPPIPTLYDIENSDGNGDYTVSWSSVNGASSYILEEDDNNSFSSPTTVYDGSGTSKAITGKHIGTYYYRVKAVNSYASSGWSWTKSAKVNTEPPLICEKHIFGDPGVQHYVYSSGISWNFTADNTMTIETVETKSVLASTRGITFHIYVKINGNTIASWSQYVNDTTYRDYYNDADVTYSLNAGDTITYKITASAGSGEAAIAWDNYVKLCGR